MKRQVISACWAVILIGVCLAGCSPRGIIVIAKQKPKGIQIIARHSGNDPGLKQPTVLLVNAVEELESLGSFELAKQEIDFDHHSLVLLTLGENPTGGYWARITGLQQEGRLLYVQALANRPGEDQAVKQELSFPYDAVVIPKIRHADVRSEVESLVGEHPQEYWSK